MSSNGDWASWGVPYCGSGTHPHNADKNRGLPQTGEVDKMDEKNSSAEGLPEASRAVEILANMAQLCLCRFVSDASDAIRLGGVLLAVSQVDNDAGPDCGDGFRCLIGLPRGVPVRGRLAAFFQERY